MDTKKFLLLLVSVVFMFIGFLFVPIVRIFHLEMFTYIGYIGKIVGLINLTGIVLFFFSQYKNLNINNGNETEQVQVPLKVIAILKGTGILLTAIYLSAILMGLLLGLVFRNW